MKSILQNISIIAPIFPLTICITQVVKGNRSKIKILILALSLLSLISDQVSIIIRNIFDSNLVWFHIYDFAESTLLLLFFYLILNKNFVKYFGLVLLIFLVVNSIFLSSHNQFNTVGIIVISISFIFLSYSYFLRLYQNEAIDVARSSTFWFVVGILVYFSGSFFTFMTYSYFENYTFHSICNTAKNGFFVIGLFNHER